MKVRAGGRTGAWIAWATLTVYWGCVAAGFLLRVRNDPDFAVWDQLFERVIGGAFPTVGAVIVAHQPRNRIGWLCCTVGLLVGPAFFAQDYAWYALVHRPGSLPGGLAMAWLSQWPLLVAFALMVTFLLLLFPDGRLVSPRWRIVAWAAAAVLAGLWIGIAFAPGPLGAGGLETVSNPLGIQWPGPLPRLLAAIVAKAFELLIHLSALLILLSAASMVVRFRRARGVERQQLKWFTYAPLAAVLVWLVSSIPALMSGPPTVVVVLRVYVVGAIISVGLPLAIGIAVLRYRLYDIDRLINRTLVYGLAHRHPGTGLCGGRPGPWSGVRWGGRRSAELGRGRRHPGHGGDVSPGSAADPGRGGSPLQPPQVQRRPDHPGVLHPPTRPGRPRHPLQPSCWRSSTRPWSRPKPRCGFDLPHPAPRTQLPVRHGRLPGPTEHHCRPLPLVARR